MNDNSIFLNFLITIPIFIIIFLSVYYINDLKGNNRILFGISLPKNYVNDSRLINIKNKYKLNVAISSLIFFMIGLLLTLNIPSLSLLFQIFGILIVSTIFYYLSYKKLLSIKNIENWDSLSSKKIYVNISTNRDNGLINLWWYIVPFFFAILSLIIVVFNINSLPLNTPLHFGFNGADKFGNGNDLSTKLSVLTLPLLNLFIVASLYFSIKNQNKRSERLSGGSLEEIKVRNYKNKKILTNFTIILSIFISIILCYLSFVTIGLININIPIMLMSTLLPIFIVLISIPIFINNNKANENLSNNLDDDIYINDDKPYKYGLFYYNKNNPSTWVPKRMGIGYTVNFATVGGKLFIIFIFLIIFILIISNFK